MKLSITLVICLIASTIAVVPACLAASYCKSCSTVTSTTCTSCFNWKMGTIGPKYMTSPTCANSVLAVAGCKIYSPNLTSATPGAGACQNCDSSKPIVELSVGGITQGVCASSLPTGCTDIANCGQMLCSSSDAGVTYTATCKMCSSGKGASAINACAGTIITNCDVSYWSASAGVAVCGYPKSGYAVDSTSLILTAYTTDSNCQQLVAGSTSQCGTCWDGYYWNTNVCKLSAKLLGAAFLAIISLFVN